MTTAASVGHQQGMIDSDCTLCTGLLCAQEVEYVKEEAKLQYLLACLQKTAPPTLIFAENKNDVDLIHEYLLMKGVEAVSVHGGKDQEDRVHAIDSFKVPFSQQ